MSSPAFLLPTTFPGRTLYPIFTVDATTGSSPAIWYHDDFNFVCEEIASYEFRSESNNFSGITVRTVMIAYVNIGTVNVTVWVFGDYDQRSQSLNLGFPDPSSSSNPNEDYAVYGTRPPLALADGRVYLAYFNFEPITTTFFNVRIDIAANSGPFNLVRLNVIGEGMEISH